MTANDLPFAEAKITKMDHKEDEGNSPFQKIVVIASLVIITLLTVTCVVLFFFGINCKLFQQ